MAIRSIVKNSIKYVPAYAGNREDKDSLYVVITPLSRKEADIYSQSTRFSQRKGFRGEWVSNSVEIQRKQFVENVLEVHNFLDGETGKEITDVREFYDTAPFDLIEEILEIILDISQLEDRERKNSKLQPDGVMKEKTGTAKNAKKEIE